MITLAEGKTHLVVKRDGRVEPYNPEKLRKVIKWACSHKTGITDPKTIDSLTNELLESVALKIYNKIKIQELYDEVIKTAALKISRLTPVWDSIARNLYLLKMYKEVGHLKKIESYPHLIEFVRKGIKHKVIGYEREKWETFTEEELEYLNSIIVYERDFNFDYLGLNIFFTKYAKKYTKTQILELPQIGFLRVAVNAFWKEDRDIRLDLIKKRYDDLSNFEYSEASPKWLSNQAASCVLAACEDDSWSINHTISSLGIMSKWGGGLELDVSKIRARGATIGNSGVSSGAVPFIKMLESVVRAYDQLGCVETDVYVKRATSFLYNGVRYDISDYEKIKGNVARNNVLNVENAEFEIVPITEIKQGDYILGYDLNKGVDKVQKVLDVYTDISVPESKRFEIELYSGSTFNTSAWHPICILDNETKKWKYIRTDELKQGDIVKGFCTSLLVKSSRNISVTNVKYIDLKVEEIQSYYVSKDKQHFILMHNSRKGAAAVYFNWWDYESPDLIKLKEESGLEDERAKHLQYGVKINELFIKRVLNNESVTLFDPKDVPDLIEAVGSEFEDLYHKYEQKSGIRKRKIPAIKLMYEILQMRSETGNLYIFFTENANKQTPYNEFINSSNLCVSGDTEIDISYTKDGRAYCKTIKIKDLCDYMKYNPYVLSYNHYTRTVEYEKILDFALTNQSAKVIKISDSVSKKSIICTPDHEIYSYTRRKYVRAKDLTPSDRLFILSRSEDEVVLNTQSEVIIEELDECIPVYDITVNNNNNFFANNILIHNCTEIFLPSRGSTLKSQELNYNISTGEYELVQRIKPGLISLCNLSSINLYNWYHHTQEERDEIAYNLLRASDNILEHSFYPVKEGELSNKIYRPIGIGVSNLAHLFASQKLKYTDPKSFEFEFRVFENLTYTILRQSVNLAKERGPFQMFDNSKWKHGWLPLDDFDFIPFELTYDWDQLRNDIMTYGVRFMTHFAIAPTATSALLLGATESINPPKQLVSLKTGTYNCIQMVPNINKYGAYYQTSFEVPNDVLLKHAAIRQIFLDQGQSIDTFYENATSASKLLEDIILAYKLGLKSLYYMNSKKKGDELDSDEPDCISCHS